MLFCTASEGRSGVARKTRTMDARSTPSLSSVRENAPGVTDVTP